MNWFYNLNIRNKLLYSFLVVSLFTVLVGYFSITKLNELKDNDTYMYQYAVLPMEKLSTVMAGFERANSLVRDQLFNPDPAQRLEAVTARKEVSAKLSAILNEYPKYLVDDDMKQEFQEFTEVRKNYAAALTHIEDLVSQGKAQEASAYFNAGVDELRIKYNEKIQKVFESSVKLSQNINTSNSSSASAAVSYALILVLLAIGVSIGGGIFIANLISRPLGKTVHVLEEMTKGHLNERLNITWNDEVGKMAKGLDDYSGRLQGFVNQMHNVAGGNLAVYIQPADDKDELAPALNKIVSTLKDVKKETDILTHAALNGELEKRGDSMKFSGGYREIIDGFNSTIEAIVKPLNETGRVLQVLSGGNFTAMFEGEFKGKYQELQNYVNNLSSSLKNLIGEIIQAVQATASASNQISSSTEEMASGAQEQSAQVSEVASAVEQMTKTVLQTAQNSSNAAELAKSASEYAKTGTLKVDENRAGMERITSSAMRTGKIISSLTNKTEQIGEIAQVIDDIADQTNLLALNAAIEAARAGEQGRGFAVVADEVRKLAERTTKATKEIAETIKDIQKEAKQADESMNEAGAAVMIGKELIEETGKALTEIFGKANEVNAEINQLAAASEELSSTAEQISRSIETISSVTQESAAGTQQIARAAEDLSRLTDNLNNLTGQFIISYDDNNRRQLRSPAHQLLR